MSRCWVRVRLVALVGAAWLAVACSASKAAQAPTSQLAEGASTSMSAPASLPAAAPVPTQLRNVAQAPKRLSVEDCIRQWSSCTWDCMGQNNPEDPNVCKSRCTLQLQPCCVGAGGDLSANGRSCAVAPVDAVSREIACGSDCLECANDCRGSKDVDACVLSCHVGLGGCCARLGKTSWITPGSYCGGCGN
jgi:hypothetical protein